MSVDQAPVKKKAKEKPSATTLAYREYERISYYLATQGDFDFKTDALARGHFHRHIETSGMPDTSHDIQFLTGQRSFGTKIPKGLHIDGLAIRTAELEKRHGKAKPEKQAAVKTPKVEKLAATPNMQRLLKKKGAKTVDEAGDLA